MTTEAFLLDFNKERIGIPHPAIAKTALNDALSSLSTIPKDSLPSTLDSLQQRLAKLNALYTQTATSLPTYDQRKCQEVALQKLKLTVATQATIRTTRASKNKEPS